MEKILSIHNYYQQKGGEDVVFRGEGKLLEEKGHKVEYLTFDNNGITSSLDKFMTFVSAPYNFRSARILRQKIKSFQPDIIHLHNFFPLGSPSLLYVARSFNIPIVMTLHNYRLVCPSATLFHNNQIYTRNINKIFPLDPIFRRVYKQSLFGTFVLVLTTGIHKLLGSWKKKMNRYIALSEFSKNLFSNSSLGIGGSQIRVKPNFSEDFGYYEGEKQKYLLFVGRLSPEKGIEIFLNAAKRIPDLKFIVLGDGPLRQLVETDSKVYKNIIYLGFKQKDELGRTLQKSMAVVFPSVCYETFGNTMIEAFSTGTTVLASDLGGTKEIVKEKVNGLLFRSNDVEDLVNKILLIKNDEKLLKQLSQNARKSYEQYYTPEANYKLLMSIYRDSIAESATA